MDTSPTTIVCTCAKYQHLAEDDVKNIVHALQSRGMNVFVTPDLCRLASDFAQDLQAMKIEAIVACHERAQSALCQFAQVESPKFYSLRGHSASELAEAMGIELVEGAESVTLPAYEDKEVAWYPVIDHDRCIQCKKCFDFCIFGVYTRDAETGEIIVSHPENCKTNCPACARVCPKGAIVFPKCPEAPINGGEGAQKDDKALEKALQDKNLYKKLAARRALARKIKLLND